MLERLALSCGAMILVSVSARTQSAELAKLVASDAGQSQEFGWAVSLSGGRALVGTPFDDDFGSQTGSAYVFERDAAGAWVEAAKLLASDAAAGDLFGYSVSLSGDRALVGAIVDDDNGFASGSAYVFERQASGAWMQVAKFLASNGVAQDEFGVAVALSGTRALVGALEIGRSARGSVYVFELQSGGSWAEVAILRASDRAANDQFGGAVSLDGDRALVGAVGDDDRGADSGSAYLFEAVGGGAWEEVMKLTADDGEPNDLFGTSVSLSGDRALVGAFFEDELASNAGAAYVFERDPGGAWLQTEKLTASDGALDDLFGRSVAMTGDLAVVGASARDQVGMDSGAAYAFRRDPGGAWRDAGKLVPDDGASFDSFGWSVAISGDRVLGGARGDADAGPFSGAAYAFDLEPLSGGGIRQVSVSGGGTQPLEIDAGHLHALEGYLVLGSLSGTAPGIPLGAGLTLPLNPGRYLTRTLEFPNRAPLAGSLGVLNAAGHADGSFTLVPFDLSLVGVEVHHAFVTFTSIAAASTTAAPPNSVPGPAFASFVSNPLPLLFVP